MNLISTVPALQSSAATHYDAWERVISEFAAARLGQPAEMRFAGPPRPRTNRPGGPGGPELTSW